MTSSNQCKSVYRWSCTPTRDTRVSLDAVDSLVTSQPPPTTMTDAVEKLTKRVSKQVLQFAARLGEHQKALTQSVERVEQRRKLALKAAADAGQPQPRSVLKKLTAGLAITDVDIDECLGFVADRLALPENEELASALGFLAIKDMNEFVESLGDMIDIETAFSNKRKANTVASYDDDDDNDLDSLDDDASAEHDFENNPESVTFLKLLLGKTYTTSTWNAAVRMLVQAFEEDSEESFGIDLGDDDSDSEEGSDEHDTDFKPTRKLVDVEAIREEALDQLMECFSHEVFAADHVAAVRESRAHQKRVAEEQQAAFLEAQAEAKRREEELARREAEPAEQRRKHKHKHRRRKRLRESHVDGEANKHQDTKETAGALQNDAIVARDEEPKKLRTEQ